MLFMSDRDVWWFFHEPCRTGKSPVYSEALTGTLVEALTTQFVKRMPSRAMRSILGVATFMPP